MSRDNGFGEWGGYMEAKITKLEEQFSAASDSFRQSNIFAGISIYVNGLTNPSSDELKRIMMVHGGTYHHYERSHTTYIIASNLPDVKVRNMNTSKIICPQWVVDCVREKRILDYTSYLLYTNQKSSQPRLCFVKKDKEKEKAVAPQVSAEQVEVILKSLDELNAKIRDSLANPGSIISELAEKAALTSASSTAAQIHKSTVAASSSGVNSVARTAVNPNFLLEFYNNSRLHHIATLGAGFKQYVSDLREQHGDAGFPARIQLKEKLKTQDVPHCHKEIGDCVMHIDMDCFFVSVGLKKHPELRGLPVAVTHSKGGSAATEVPVHPGADRQLEGELFARRFEQHLHNNMLSDKVRNGFDAKMSLSEIASCSYEARAKGIRNGMFVGQAVKLCPELQTLPYDFEGYREVAFTLYNIVAQYTLHIEAVSCDELFVDLSYVLADVQVSPMDFVRAIREEVRQKTGCPCSAGVGANKLQARMATKKAKPDGQYHLLASEVETYMKNIPIKDLPGVGSSNAYTLQEAKLLSCGDLQKVSLTRIQMLVGKKFGETLYQFCRGVDNRSLAYEQVRKSVSAEVNYGIRFKEYAELKTFLRQLCTEVHARLLDIKRKTKCITLKLMVRSKDAPVETSKFMGHGVCDNVTKSVSLSDYTQDLTVITRNILSTMKMVNLPPNELRGIGIQLSKLDDPNEAKDKKKDNVLKSMFERVAERQKGKKADMTIDTTIKAVERSNKTKSYVSGAIKTTAARETANKTNSRAAKGAEVRKRHNVTSMLQHAAVKRAAEINNDNGNNVVTTFDTIVLPADIDPEVFAALPADIRAEILHDRAQQEAAQGLMAITAAKHNASTLNESDLLPSTSRAAQEKRLRIEPPKVPPLEANTLQVDAEFLAALPPDLRAEIEAQIAAEERGLRTTFHPTTPPKVAVVEAAADTEVSAYNDINVENVFAQQNCIQQLLDWVKSCTEPTNDDVDLLADYAREMVRAKEIDRLYEPLLYLCRLINNQKDSTADCAWHAAYKGILAAVQAEMYIAYDGQKLYVGAKLQCDKCKT